MDVSGRAIQKNGKGLGLYKIIYGLLYKIMYVEGLYKIIYGVGLYKIMYGLGLYKIMYVGGL